MTELQKVFLFYSCVFVVAQFALYLGFHVALIMLERSARIKHKKCKALVQEKRQSEQERWKVAYDLYYQKHPDQAKTALKEAS